MLVYGMGEQPLREIMRGVNQGPYHHLDVLKHSLESVRQLELVMQEQGKDDALAVLRKWARIALESKPSSLGSAPSNGQMTARDKRIAASARTRQLIIDMERQA